MEQSEDSTTRLAATTSLSAGWMESQTSQPRSRIQVSISQILYHQETSLHETSQDSMTTSPTYLQIRSPCTLTSRRRRSATRSRGPRKVKIRLRVQRTKATRLERSSQEALQPRRKELSHQKRLNRPRMPLPTHTTPSLMPMPRYLRKNLNPCLQR